MATLRPILAVPDVDAAAAFYCDKLGFDLQFALQDKNDATFFASVGFHDCSILFSRQAPREVPASLRRQIRADMTIIITLPADSDIDAFHAELAVKGVNITEALADKFWGNREFSIQDPNGYCIAFALSNRDVSLEEAKDISAQLDLGASGDHD